MFMFLFKNFVKILMMARNFSAVLLKAPHFLLLIFVLMKLLITDVNIGPVFDCHDNLKEAKTVQVDEPPDSVYNSKDVFDLYNPNGVLDPYNSDDVPKEKSIFVLKDDNDLKIVVRGPFMKIKAKVNDDRESVNAKDVLDEKFAIKALKVDETLEPAPNFVDTLDPVPQYKFGQASSGQKYNVPRLLDRFWMDLEHNEEVTSFAKLCCHGSEDLLS